MSEESKLTFDAVVKWLDKSIKDDSKLLSKRPLFTDSGMDVTEGIKGRLNAYIEVRGYIRRGKMGQD